MEPIRKIIRTVIRESLFSEQVIEETQTGQKDLQNLTNKILKMLADEILREKSRNIHLAGNENQPIKNLPATNTLMLNKDGFLEIGEFVEDAIIRIVPTKLIQGKKSIKGQLEYTPPDKFGNGFFKIWLKYDDNQLKSINDLFDKEGRDVTQQDIYIEIFYMFYSVLLHELQHAYDAWRSDGKAFNSQLNKKYVKLQDKADEIIKSKIDQGELTPEEIEAINNSSKAYLNLIHEINARYAQAIHKVRLTKIDYNTFDDIKAEWDDVYRQFKVNFYGWNHLSDKMKKKLVRRLAKAYQEESENLKTAKEKYSKEELEMVSESLQSKNISQNKKIAGGVLVKCISTDRVFLLLRNDPTPKWSLVSGTIEEGESVLSGLKREFYEELFINPSIVDFKFIRKEYISEKNIEFHYYEGFVDEEFSPILNEENLDSKWYSFSELPIPLYNGMSDRLREIFKNTEVKEDLRLVSEDLSTKKLDYRIEYMGGYGTQQDYELGLYIDDEIIGMVQYTLFEGDLTIRDVIVRPEYRRKGYGSKMMKFIKNEHPEYTYKPSMMTDLGAKFVHKDVELSEVRKMVIDILSENLFEQRGGESRIEKVYHGTSLKKAINIRNGGLKASESIGYQSPGWYMVSTDFESALFHATAEDGEDAVVFEFDVPIDNLKWEGHPYFWPPYERSEKSKWYALKQPISKNMITDIHYVKYDDFLNQKNKGF